MCVSESVYVYVYVYVCMCVVSVSTANAASDWDLVVVLRDDIFAQRELSAHVSDQLDVMFVAASTFPSDRFLESR